MSFVNCPTCKRAIEYSPDNKWRPFCSERCKLIDLGEWAAEKHAIPVENIDENTQQFGRPDGE
jgi:endogenous inhibitor of DNA gyrase (YacG/DUF329 family)